jgi:RHS repeat-associated protein
LQNRTNISSTFSEYCTGYYGFGFNGKEKDDEVKGNNNSYDFGARIYDSRTGRWLSTDPLANKFPNESPYLFAGNNPILYIDPDGKKKVTSNTFVDTKTGVTLTITITEERSLKSRLVQTSAKIFGFIPNHDYSNEYAWYDSEVKNTFYVKDGKIVGSEYGEEQTIGDPKTTTFANWKKAAERKVYGAEKSKGWGGINWTSEIGQSGESRVADENVRSESIDGILAAMSATLRSSGSKIPKNILEGVSFVIDNSEAASDVRNIVETIVGGDGSSSENNGTVDSCGYCGGKEEKGTMKTIDKGGDHGGPIYQVKKEK